MISKHKNILIISPFNLNNQSATGITLQSIFNSWPKEKLLVINTVKSGNSYANTLYIESPVVKLLRTFVQRLSKKTNKEKVIPSTITNGRNRISSLRKMHIIGVSYFDLFFSDKFTKQQIKQIKKFKPDAIYTLMGSQRIIKTCLNLSAKYEIPIIPHFMDDWISTIYTGDFFLKLPRFFTERLLRKLLQRSDFGFVISEKMVIEYTKRYKKRFHFLMNCIEIEDYKAIPKSHQTNDIIISYFGGLHLNRWKSLNEFSNAIKNFADATNNVINIDVYAPLDDISNFSSKIENGNVFFHSYISHKFAIEKMCKSDFLLHIESFDKDVMKFTKFSISTKIPEYLASGTRIFAIGPSSIASIEYLKVNKCAYVATSLAKTQLINIVSHALLKDEKEIFRNNNQKVAVENHNNKKLLDII